MADEINRLDVDPPSSEQEFLTQNTGLMNRWRDLSIMAIQVPDAPAQR